MLKSLFARFDATPAPSASTEIGCLDFASRKIASGWAWPQPGQDHAMVDFFVDDELYATTIANRVRADLGVTGRSDLAFILPWELPREDRALTVRARVRGAPADLPNSPIELPPISLVKSVDNPDWYLAETQKFLQWRFDEAGYVLDVYNGHQPLYGFGIQPCEPGWLERYTITHSLMTELAALDFKTLADIGGAEGYKGALIRDTFGVKVLSADLSPAACALAERIYGLETRSVTMEHLPFEDDSFDVVLCSESLEHVSQPDLSLSELLRIARLAVVITVPVEPLEQVSASIQNGDPHGHVNQFDLRSFDRLQSELHSVQTRAILNTDPDWRNTGRSVEALLSRFPHDPILREGGRSMMGALVEQDQTLIAQGTEYTGMVAVLEKRPCRRGQPLESPSIHRILDYAVPPVKRPVPDS